MREPLVVTWYEDGVPVVAPVGEFDLATIDELSKWLTSAAEHGQVIVDLHDTEFLDLAALGVINDVQASGVPVVLRGAHGPVRRILELTHAH